MPPTVQDDQPAVVLDELIMIHGRVTDLADKKQQAAAKAR